MDYCRNTYWYVAYIKNIVHENITIDLEKNQLRCELEKWKKYYSCSQDKGEMAYLVFSEINHKIENEEKKTICVDAT